MGKTQGAVDIKTSASPVPKPCSDEKCHLGTELKTAHLGQDVGETKDITASQFKLECSSAFYTEDDPHL